MANNEYVYRNLSERDEAQVKQLVKSSFRNFLWGDYWEWKYPHNPNFDSSMVAVAERDGKIIGCNHWLIRDFKLTDSLTVKALLCADIAVDPNHRKQGIGKSLLLFLRSTRVFKEKGAVVNYMFANPELGKSLYGPVVGYTPVPTSTVTYAKRLNWKRITQRIGEINQKMDLSRPLDGKTNKHSSNIALHFSGAPPLTITISDGRILINEESVKSADVKVETDLATLMNLRTKKSRMKRLLKALLTRRLKVRGNLFGIYRLYKCLSLLEEVLVS